MSVSGPSSKRLEGGGALSYAMVAAKKIVLQDDSDASATQKDIAQSNSNGGGVTSSAVDASARPNMPRQRSRGQIARRYSITRGSDARASQRRKQAEREERAAAYAKASKADQAKRTASQTPRGIGGSGERPWLGGLYFTDIVFIAFTYSINLLRTLGFAEIADVAIKGLVYAITRLPFDLYKRWSLSTPPFYVPDEQVRKNAAQIRRRRKKRRSHNTSNAGNATSSSSDSEAFESLSRQPAIFASSHEEQPEPTTVDQLSPFHHMVILLSRFACSNFPHLLPRVLFAEETIGPFVYWRTGGGSNAMVQEFTDRTDRRDITLNKSSRGQEKEESSSDNGGFRAYLLSKDARMPIEVQRSNFASRSATTLLYLHGGGFSLGSVAFYAEALLRLRAKVAMLEAKGAAKLKHAVAEARCVAVEYDLSPAARFPLPLLQCLRCYAHLIEVEQIEPESICLAGDSAGGNLAMGMLLCLSGQMRDELLLKERDWSKLPMPGKAVLISPWVDLRPKKAHTFAELRNESRTKETTSEYAEHEQKNASLPERVAGAWTDAVYKYDWDFVAAEALLHFAQVYAGVMPSPRRVHGPLGWIAHVCGVLTMQYDENEDEDEDEEETEYAKGKLKGFIDLSRSFSILSNPSKRLAKMTYDALSDPLLPRLLGLKLDNSQAEIIARQDSITAGFEPLFTPFDRRTDVVASQSQLYESIDGPLSTTGLDKIGMDQQSIQTRLHARHLLDTHPLLSPAMGDWSQIKLKHGCLVTWGERERMAEDIESWVDSVTSASAARMKSPHVDAPPAPDDVGHNVNNDSSGRTSVKNTFEEENEDHEWMYTAVEKGPGGVHAWPYVSMYLAGSESERERGLDLLARFVARSTDATDAEAAIEDERDTTDKIEKETKRAQTLEVDLPHAAPTSPDIDGDSVGSMPSDVDLHGLVDDGMDFGYDMQHAPVNIADAVRRAQELGYTDTELSALSDGETTASEGSSKQHTPRSAPRKLKTSSSAAKRPGRAVPVNASTPPIRSPSRQVAPPAPSISPTRERGRSRSPRKPVHLVTPTSKQVEDSSSFVSGVTLHVPSTMRNEQPSSASQQSSQTNAHQGRQQTVTPLWWTGSTIGTKTTRDVEPEDRPGHHTPSSPKALMIDVTPKAKPATLKDEDDEIAGEELSNNSTTLESEAKSNTSQHSLGDIQEASSSDEALSPALAASTFDTDASSMQQRNGNENVDPSIYGLSHWAIRRPEPEGLSDIAEEGSVLSASITSGGEEDRSRSLSPVNVFRIGQPSGDVSGSSGTTSLTEAATQFMQGQKLPSSGSGNTVSDAQPDTPRQWRYLRDEIGIRRRDADEEDDGDEDAQAASGDLAVSPPAKPQPGPSLPVMSGQSITKGGERKDVEQDDKQEDTTQPGAININRKKPKGDVWW